MIRTLKSIAVCLVLTAIPFSAAQTSEAETTTRGPDTSRILSIGGDVTEILYALERGSQVIAVDTTSLFPPEILKQKRKVGYMGALSAEGVLSVAPSIILASANAGPPEVVRALKSSSIPYVEIPSEPTVSGITRKISSIAKAIGAEVEGQNLVKSIGKSFTDLAAARKLIKKRMRVLFVLNAAGGRMIVGGRNTSADAVLKLAGAENAASNLAGFKPITAEALIAMAPDAILVMKKGWGGHDSEGLKSSAAVKATPAGEQGKFKDIDGLYLLGFGPRTPQAAKDVMSWLYEERPAEP